MALRECFASAAVVARRALWGDAGRRRDPGIRAEAEGAKDTEEVMILQSEFLGRRVQALSTQVHELGQSAAKMVVDSTRPKP